MSLAQMLLAVGLALLGWILGGIATWFFQVRQWEVEENRRQEDIKREIQRQFKPPVAVGEQDCPGRTPCTKLGVYVQSMCYWNPRTKQTTAHCWAALIQAVSGEARTDSR